MFENYIATKEDLQAIEEGLSYVWKKELDFIFEDKEKIAKTLVISFDSKTMYVWERKGRKYAMNKLPHKIKIEDRNQSFWCASLILKEMARFLPRKWRVDWYEKPKISGGLLTPFIELQKKKKLRFNPYTTYESYLATIVHEFGHVYYNQHKLWWYSNKKENLNYIKKALKLYKHARADLKKIELRFNTYRHLTELFAFCTDYTAASIFWPQHKEDIDRENAFWTPKLIEEEKKRNLDTQDSVLDKESHNFAAIMGRLVVELYPKKWPEVLLGNYYL